MSYFSFSFDFGVLSFRILYNHDIRMACWHGFWDGVYTAMVLR